MSAWDDIPSPEPLLLACIKKPELRIMSVLTSSFKILNVEEDLLTSEDLDSTSFLLSQGSVEVILKPYYILQSSFY